MPTTGTTIRKILLASSAEVADHRREFEIAIRRKNDLWIEQGAYLRLTIWEDFLDVLSKTRLQDEYNREIRQCDVFVMLYRSKVGRYTEEEFATAVGQFQATSRPFIYTYFCDSPDDRATASADDLQSPQSFQEKLRALGHFQTRYTTTAELCAHFVAQLDKLAANGFVEFVRDAETTRSLVVGDNNRGAIKIGRRIDARPGRDARGDRCPDSRTPCRTRARHRALSTPRRLPTMNRTTTSESRDGRHQLQRRTRQPRPDDGAGL